jgi:hypothetical protein
MTNSLKPDFNPERLSDSQKLESLTLLVDGIKQKVISVGHKVSTENDVDSTTLLSSSLYDLDLITSILESFEIKK